MQRKIERKLKSKKLTDIQCNTQIKNVKCAKFNGTQNCNIKKICNILQQRYHSQSSNLYQWQMSNIKLHASTVWTLRNKKEITWKDKKWRRRIREKYSQSEHSCFSIQKKGTQLLTACTYSVRKQNMALCMCVQCVCKCGLNLLCMTLANYFSKHR